MRMVVVACLPGRVHGFRNLGSQAPGALARNHFQTLVESGAQCVPSCGGEQGGELRLYTVPARAGAAAIPGQSPTVVERISPR